jgi:sulfatase modifying factor 1
MIASSRRRAAMSIEPDIRPRGMAPVEGGVFTMGSNDFYAEERPARSVTVATFLIDITPVTNVEFARFVAATGHRSHAEIHGASWVFSPPPGPVDLRAPPSWWELREGACWYATQGRGSTLDQLERHPVVHVTHADAAAYAAWAGKRLPAEEEWEYAARGSLEGTPYAWGDKYLADGRHMANTWQGRFPHEDLALDGYAGTSPVGSYPPGGFGTYDMIGNVWEWTATPSSHGAAESCCSAADTADFVLKGGSWLCSRDYCRRYRPAARMFERRDYSSGNVGFRCVLPASA